VAFLRALPGEQVRLYGVDISLEHIEWAKRKSPGLYTSLDPVFLIDNYESRGLTSFEAYCLPLN
jgi:hypothetical protein